MYSLRETNIDLIQYTAEVWYQLPTVLPTTAKLAYNPKQSEDLPCYQQLSAYLCILLCF